MGPSKTGLAWHGTARHLQGNYPPVLDYYSEDVRALARAMISTNPTNRPSAEEVLNI